MTGRIRAADVSGENHAPGASGRNLSDSTLRDDRWLPIAAATIYAALSPKEQAVLLAAARGAEDKEISSRTRLHGFNSVALWQRTYKKTHTASRRRLVAAIWRKLASSHHCHFLNDMTGWFDSAKVPRVEAFENRDLDRTNQFSVR